MLSPLHNRRRDTWGGSFEGRFALLRESVLAVRRAVGEDFPVTVKLNAHDGVPGRGLDLDTSVRVGRELEALGVDAIEVSAGTADVGMGCYPNRGGLPVDLGRRYLGRELPFLRPVLPFLGAIVRVIEPTVRLREEAYFLPLAERFARELRIPILCVGGVRSRAVAERVLAGGVAMVSLGRPLVRQPGLPRAWREGRDPEAQCISCNRCFVELGLGEPLRCWQKVEHRPPGR
jgi:2,4-dienoyl-CoA reductase-like NADH-dependent reductase (Old Yellow Enzyme family)